MSGKWEKTVLGTAFCLLLLGRKATVAGIADRLGVEKSYVAGEVRRMEERGLVETKHGGVRLTGKGRAGIRVVFIGGGFEVVHLGHLHTIEKAKALGDVLVVSVARDSTIRKRKKREPLIPEGERARLLSALRPVDAAVLGVEGDIYQTLERVKPDVVALGYDQHHGEGDIRREARRRGMKVEVVRLDSPRPGLKTSRLLEEF